MIVFSIQDSDVQSLAPFTDMLHCGNTRRVPMAFKFTRHKVVRYNYSAIGLKCYNVIVPSVYHMPRLTVIDS